MSSNSKIVTELAPQLPELAAALLSCSKDCVQILSVDGKVQYVSKNGCLALGITELDRIIGSTWGSMWPRESRHQVTHALDQARKGQNTEFQAICPTVNGHTREWLVQVMPLRDAAGQVTRILANMNDITEELRTRKAMELALRDTTSLLGQRDTLISEMDHRVKNSLSLVTSLLRIQARQARDAYTRDAFDAAIAQVMAIARVHGALQKRGASDEVSCQEFLQSLTNDMRMAVSLDADWVMDVDPALTFDSVQASQIGLAYVELIQNAVKHAETPDLRLDISLQVGAFPNAMMVLQVRDNGDGLSDSFDLNKSAGFGLSMCTAVARQLRGTFHAFNADIGGAVFEIQIPQSVTRT